ncbi:MAG TPA: 30S ribosomal protein S16 [Actinomycetota bacterium]|nr:30S ribosomal protein S16 [Actinomycetota bacterium]
MVKIRLMRVGAKKRPLYRVVVAESRSPRDGKFIEIIGQYDPVPNPSEISIDSDKALAWLNKGAQPTESTLALLKRTGIWTQYTASQPRKPKADPKARRGPVKGAAKGGAKA